MQEGWIGPELLIGISLVFCLLCSFQLLSFIKRQHSSASWENFHQRLKTWWLLFAPITLAILLGPIALIFLWCLISTWAVYEMCSVAALDPRDKNLKTYLLAAPWLLALMQILGLPFLQALFLLLLPVPLLMIITGHTSRFLERMSYLQWILVQIVGALGVAFLLIYEAPAAKESTGKASIFFFILCLTQLHDVMQYVVGKVIGKHPILPLISPMKTWEGLIGGLLLTSLLGAFASSVTKLSFEQGFLVSALICFSGFGSDVMMSAIKRGLGIKDYGKLLKGHGGLLDRIDSLLLSFPLAYVLLTFLS